MLNSSEPQNKIRSGSAGWTEGLLVLELYRQQLKQYRERENGSCLRKRSMLGAEESVGGVLLISLSYPKTF